VLHAYHLSDGDVRDDAPRSSGHALKSVSLSPLVPATTFLFYNIDM